jgi:hypothetical protein
MHRPERGEKGQHKIRGQKDVTDVLHPHKLSIQNTTTSPDYSLKNIKVAAN